MPSERNGHEQHQSLPMDASRRNPRPLPQTRRERYIYTYRLVANGAPLQFLIIFAQTHMQTRSRVEFRVFALPIVVTTRTTTTALQGHGIFKIKKSTGSRCV